MNFDFSALLVLLTFASGAVWAFDLWILRPRRAAGNAGHGESKAVNNEPLLVEYARSFFPVFLIVLILRSFVVEPFRIPSASMMPTLLIGDFILVNKYEYGLRLPVANTRLVANETPERGDIIVFRYPEKPSIPFIKRVVGIPGDHIVYKNKSLYINGLKVSSEMATNVDPEQRRFYVGGSELAVEHLGDTVHEILTNPTRPSIDVEAYVPAGHYFVLGDNRDNSKDSRFWGFVPDENLIGRAFLIWMNWDLKNGGVNWRRIGTIMH